MSRHIIVHYEGTPFFGGFFIVGHKFVVKMKLHFFIFYSVFFVFVFCGLFLKRHQNESFGFLLTLKW
jgi:hypothetical protein